MGIIELLIVLVFVMWLLGMIALPGQAIVHALIILILVLVAVRLLQGRRIP